MYIVAQCRLFHGAPMLQAVFLRQTIQEAQDLAVKIAVEQLVAEKGFEDDAVTVREAIESSKPYFVPSGNWSIAVAFCQPS